MARVQVPVTDLAPVKAALTTALTGTHNDLTFTAKRGGTWGNSIQVAYVDPAGNNQLLSVQVDGFLITVNLATDGVGAITSTAAQIAAAIRGASQDAAALVDVDNAASNDGSGVVTAQAATSLAGGAYGASLPAVTNGDATNGHYFTGNTGEQVIRVISSDAGSQTVTIKRSPTLAGGVPASDEVISVPAGATVEIGPFPPSEFNQNRYVSDSQGGEIYFNPSVSNTLDFLVYAVARAM